MAMGGRVKRNRPKPASGPRPVVRVRTLTRRLPLLLAGGLITTPASYAGNGLPAVLPGGHWTGALAPRLVNGGLDMVIDQTGKSATLDWQSFNIDANHGVRFNQPSSDAVALNRIYDSAPSQINGRLSANGQIYLINRNGIVFGEHSQVNVNTLIASTLNIEDSVFEEGILGAIQNGKAAFVADADMPADATIDVQAGAQLGATEGAGGRILILAPNIINHGSIQAPDGQAVLAAAKDRVYLAQSGDPNLRGVLVEVKTGGNLDNLGSIIAERGNVSLMGLTVNQDGLVRATSTVSLNGSIRLVAGDNSADSDSAVANRIKNVLFAKSNYFTTSGGTLELGKGSVTEVVPEGSATATDGQSQPASFIDMAARDVTVTKGARVTSTGGDVNLLAKTDLSDAYTTRPTAPEEGVALNIESGAVIDVSGDTSAVVPVSRNVVAVEARGNELADSPLQRNGPIRNQVLYVDVRTGTPFLNIAGAAGLIQRGVGERLAQGGNITLQSAGDVVVEDGATLNIRGGRVTYTGDTIFTSQLITDDGQVVDIANADPNRHYIGLLGPDLVINHAKWGVTEVFQGATGRYEPGYVEGKDAGTLLIQTRRLAFNGTLLADSIAGSYQRLAPAPSVLASGALRPFDQRPSGGGLRVDLTSTAADTPLIFAGDAQRLDDPERGQTLSDGRPAVLSADMLGRSGLSTLTVNSTGSITVAAPLDLPDDGALSLKAGKVDINQDIHSAGGAVSVTVERSTGDGGNGIQVPLDESALQVAGGVRIDVSGLWTNDSPRLHAGLPTTPIVIDGGKISLASGGDLILGEGGVLDVSAGAQLAADGTLNAGKGGAIALSSTDNRGASASQLVVAAQLRGYAFDNGGSLALTANRILVADRSPLDALLHETQANGSVRYQRIGTSKGPVQTLYDQGSGESLLVVDPAFFQSGGFDNFALNSTRSGLEVAAGTHVDLGAQNRLIDGGTLAQFIASNGSRTGGSAEPGNGNPLEPVPTGTPLDSFTRIGLLPDYLRGPVDLHLASQNAFGYGATGEYPILEVATGAAIQGRPRAEVSLASDTELRVDGSIEAPAGAVSLTLNSSFGVYVPQQTIYLGEHARLSADGAVILKPRNDLGLREGQVLDAGSVTLQANLGSIVTAAGSRIAVDAVASTLDFQIPNAGVVSHVIAGRAGRIDLTAAESMLLQGGLSGRAALPDSAGGELDVTLDPSHRKPEDREINPDSLVPLPLRFPNDPRIINLAAYPGALPTPGTALPTAAAGQAFLPVQSVRQGGFDTLQLSAQPPGSPSTLDSLESNGIIRFAGDTNLSLRARLVLDAPTLISDGAEVRLSAAYVALGSTDTRYPVDGTPTAAGSTARLDPTGGSGLLRVNADRIDLVGDTVLQGFGNEAGGGVPAIDLVSRGDIRLLGVRLYNGTDWNGSLRSTGDLQLQARQIYPATLSRFALAVEAPGGRIDLLGQHGTPGEVLSAGGSVTFSADNITVHGGAIVRAPIGAIDLTGTALDSSGEPVGARNIVLGGGSLLSTSAAGLSIPFGYTQFQTDLVLPLPSEGKTLQFVADPTSPIEKALPQKHIVLSGEAVDVRPGAQFDLSGGGDVRATEFIPGPGGSKDVLLADLDTGSGVTPNPSFAILPLLGGQFAPFDPIESPAAHSVQGINVGDTLILEEGINGLPAGEYAVLPARYALFGGYLVTPVAGTQDMLAGQNRTRLDGAPILAGHLGVAGTAISDSRSQGFALEDGTRVRQRAEYAETSLDTLFANAAVRTPRDAGNLTVQAGDALHLAGRLVPTVTGGRGSEVDIVANQLAILSQSNGGSGVGLLASDLAGLNADSLLIGATRTLTPDGLHINPGAARIDVAGGVDLDVRELILVADQLNLGDGAAATRLAATGTTQDVADHLVVGGNAAVATVSTAKGVTLSREDDASPASLDVTGGVTLAASGSVVLDANGDVNLAGTVDADGGTLSLGGSSVSLGDIAGRGLSGLVLSGADLARLAGSDLTLRSSGTIDVYSALGDPGAISPAFARLALDARGIVGHENAGDSVYLSANELVLLSHSGGAAPSAPESEAQLVLQADRVTLDQGDFSIAGFGQTTLRAGAAMIASNAGTLDVSGNLSLAAPVLAATGGADHTIKAGGVLATAGADPDAPLPGGVGPGARLQLDGARIDFAGNAVLPSGNVSLHSTGDLLLDSGATIDAAGRDELFASRTVGSPGGVIAVDSQTGSITVRDGVTLDVSASPAGGDAGRLELSAPQGSLAIAPAALLHATDSGANRGEIVIDAGVLAGTGAAGGNALTSLNEQLEAGGFRGLRDLRSRSGDLQLDAGQAMHAHEVTLTADSGRLVIDGSIDASGSDGGSIKLSAGDALDVNGTLDAHATSVAGNGGRIELAALDADGDDSGHQDVVNLNAGAVLDLRGGANGGGGFALVRGLAYDANNDGGTDSVAVGHLDADVIGAAHADVEAVHEVTVADGVITDDERAAWRNMIDQFMSGASVSLAPGWRLVPGLEARSTGDLTLPTAWDLYAKPDNAAPSNDWRFGPNNDIALILTLRAAGNVNLKDSLTDGFTADQFYVASDPVAYDRLGVGESTRYRIVAGADLGSADVLATEAQHPSDVRLASGKTVRTGTGDIDVAASGNVDIGQEASLYTAGVNAGFGPLADIDVNLQPIFNFVLLPDGDFVARPATGEEFLLAMLNQGQFPVQGGDVRITAGGDLLGQANQASVADWQPRVGGDFDHGGIRFDNLPTYWAIAFQEFKNGVGALGGGNVTARIGGNVEDVAIALPTTGKSETAQVVLNDASALAFASDRPAPVVYGGGDLELDVGGSLTGGAIQVDRGTGTVRVGGDLGEGTARQQPYFATADTRLDIDVAGTADLGGVFNSTTLPQLSNLSTLVSTGLYLGGNITYDPLFFSYTAASRVNLTALAGDVSLRDPAPISGHGFALYPATLEVGSLQKGISVAGDIQTFPSAYGQVELLAQDDIRYANQGAGPNWLIQSDADPALLPGSSDPAVLDITSGSPHAATPVDIVRNQFLMPPDPNAPSTNAQGRHFHAATPVHAGDTQPDLVVSRAGSLVGKTGPDDVWQLILAKQTQISVGQDIRNMSFSIQHNQDTDLSLIQAQGDVVQQLSRNPLNGAFTASQKALEIAGPGRLDVLAGGNIDLGTSKGVISIGDTANSALNGSGAGVVLIAGLGKGVDYDAFVKTYLEDSPLYRDDLNAFLAARGIDPAEDPLGAFENLSPLEQRGLILKIFFNELRESGSDAETSGRQDYSRGFAAIATLFPGTAGGGGDISTPVSVVKTVDGGDIDMLAPYGSINAGATFRAIEKKSDQLGVIAGRGGDINIFLDGDLQVNRERVFALQGDLLAWSSNGSIDAGKGAKTVVSVPDPIVTTDANGNTIVTFPPAVDGSGLSASGNAYLFAPHGVINAGDAGIRVQGNLIIGARQVLGAENINVGGAAVGVPTAPPAVSVGMVDAGALSSSAASLAEAATSNSIRESSDSEGAGETLGMLSVQVLGFGDSDAGGSSTGEEDKGP